MYINTVKQGIKLNPKYNGNFAQLLVIVTFSIIMLN